MDVIGAGFGRTGTTSLTSALELLGFGPCHNMQSLRDDPALGRSWEAVVRGHPTNWSQLLARYRSAIDWPVCSYWRELAEVFPAAKIILTVRDPSRWYESARKTIYPYTCQQSEWGGLMMRLENLLTPELAVQRKVCQRLIWDGEFAGSFTDRDFAVEVFNRHIDRVCQEIPPERLLVFEVSQGWEPLCDFLGVPVPSESFPKMNHAERFQRMMASRRRRALTLRPAIPRNPSRRLNNNSK